MKPKHLHSAPTLPKSAAADWAMLIWALIAVVGYTVAFLIPVVSHRLAS